MDDDVYVPSPWGSLKWVGIWGIGVVIALAVIWWGWDWWAGKVLREKIAWYREKGEVVTMEELAGKVLAPGENRVEKVDEASDALLLTAGERGIIDVINPPYEMKLPLEKVEMEGMQGIIAKNEKVTELLVAARKCAGGYFLMAPHAYMTRMGLKLGKWRVMDNYLRSVAFYEHQGGRDDLVDDTFEEMETIGSAAREEHAVIGHLISIACLGLNARMLIDVAPDLEIGKGANGHGVKREVVERWIRELLESRAIEESLQRSLIGDRLIVEETGREMEEYSFLMRGLFRLGEVRTMDYMDRVAGAFGGGLRSQGEVVKALPQILYNEGNLYRAVHFLETQTGDYDRVVFLQNRVVMDRRAAALRLALRLYEVDHGGELPRELGELVPRYLPDVPVDLFRADGKGLTYVRERRLFYSVGLDGVDDGGQEKVGDQGVNWYSARDAVYRLDRGIVGWGAIWKRG